MNTELDILILKMKKLHLDTAFIERNYNGYWVNTDEFFEKLKLLLLENVIIKEKEIANK